MKSDIHLTVQHVQGGSRGIGYETALDLAKRGAEVIIAGIDFPEVSNISTCIISS